MEKKDNQAPEGIYYGDYLQLNKLLGAQYPLSQEQGQEQHEETLFIIGKYRASCPSNIR